MTNTSKKKMSKELDQFYTNPQVALNCVKLLKNILPKLEYKNMSFMEPCAGTGSFVNALQTIYPLHPIIATDIDPQREDIITKDFLKDDLTDVLKDYNRNNLVIVGNPPFGKRSRLALSFLERSFELSETVCFILPLQFRRFLTQKNIRQDAHLILDIDCPLDSFIFEEKPYDVRCCFQVWSLRSNIEDLRKRVKPKTVHSDFKMWTYNCTIATEKFFEEDWIFAVQRQGWCDFKPILRKDIVEPLSLKKQWMLFGVDNDKILNRLLNLDFELLASQNTSVRGFGKSDVIELYNSLYNENTLS